MPEKYIWGAKAIREQRYLNENTRAFIAERQGSFRPSALSPVLCSPQADVGPGQAGDFRLLQGNPGAYINSNEPIRMWNLIMAGPIFRGQQCLAIPSVMPGSEDLVWVAWHVDIGGQGSFTDCTNCSSGELRETKVMTIAGVQDNARQPIVADRLNVEHELLYNLDLGPGRSFLKDPCTRRTFFDFDPQVSNVASVAADNGRWGITLELRTRVDIVPVPEEYYLEVKIIYDDDSSEAVFEGPRSTSKVDCTAGETDFTLISYGVVGGDANEFTPHDHDNTTITLQADV